jgi:hypothetical protein
MRWESKGRIVIMRICYDDHGVTSGAINLAFRLLEAGPLRAALAGSAGVLAVITSDWFFDEVVRHSLGTRPGDYRAIPVDVKETTTVGWISVPDDRRLLSGTDT